jgi:phosphatidylglycerophosphate synthase
MQRKPYTSNVITLVCALLILSFFVAVLLPHAHTCHDEFCVICNFNDILKKLMGIAMLLYASGCICDIFLRLLASLNLRNGSSTSTPVKLKVKLSN